MKRFGLIAVAALLSLGGSAFAQSTTTSSFTVSVNFTPICNVQTQPGNLSFGLYTPFVGAATPSPSTTATFRCSRGITPDTVVLTSTGAGVTTSAASATGASASGVLNGLVYSVTASAVPGSPTTAGQDAAAGAAGAAGTGSTANLYDITITANMPASQAGGTGGDSSHSYTLTLAY